MSLSSVLPFPTVHKTQKNYQVRSLSQHLLSLALSFNNLHCLICVLMRSIVASYFVFYPCFSSLLTLAPPPSLCRLPSPTCRPSSGSRRPSLGSRLPLDCADLPLIALRCLVCFGKSKKRKAIKKKENKVGTHTTKNKLPHIG